MFIFKKKRIIPTPLKLSTYLPIGSIIKVHNDDTLYMIYRYMGNTCLPIKQSNSDFQKSILYTKEKTKENIYYYVDYAICPYKVDDVNATPTYYINQEDIKEIVFLGYNDSYRENILKDLDNWNEENI